MLRLSTAIAERGIFSSQDVADPDLGLDSTIRFAWTPWQELGRVFKSERALAYHLSKYPSALEQALPHLGDFRHLSGGRKPERTYFYHEQPVRPDLVFRSRRRHVVVVELERGDPRDESIDQLERYLVAAETKHNRPVAGILVTARPRYAAQRRQVSRNLGNLQERYPNSAWLWYDVAVTLQSAETS